MKWIATMACALALAAAPAAAAEFGKPGMAGVRITVKDDAKAIKFYQVLGMKIGRLHHPGQQEMTWENQVQGPPLIIVTAEPGARQVPGNASFMIFTPSVAGTVVALREAGFTAPDPKVGAAPIVELSIQDPDGNWILLIGPKPK